jgi:hypothetical protein
MTLRVDLSLRLAQLLNLFYFYLLIKIATTPVGSLGPRTGEVVILRKG